MIPKVAGSIPVSHPSVRKASANAGAFLLSSPCFLVCHRGGIVVCDDAQMKTCAHCKVTKSLDEFYKKSKAGGIRYICKMCQLAYVRDHYRRTAPIYNARRYNLRTKYTTRNQRIVYEYLSEHACVDCGEDDIIVLDFDHVRGTKQASISSMISAPTSTVTLLAEMEKCDVRCANCHRRKTANERGTYRLTPSWLNEKADDSDAGPLISFLWDGRVSNPRQTA